MELSEKIVLILVLLGWIYLIFFHKPPAPRDVPPMSGEGWEQLECTPNYMGGCD